MMVPKEIINEPMMICLFGNILNRSKDLAEMWNLSYENNVYL